MLLPNSALSPKRFAVRKCWGKDPGKSVATCLWVPCIPVNIRVVDLGLPGQGVSSHLSHSPLRHTSPSSSTTLISSSLGLSWEPCLPAPMRFHCLEVVAIITRWAYPLRDLCSKGGTPGHHSRPTVLLAATQVVSRLSLLDTGPVPGTRS